MKFYCNYSRYLLLKLLLTLCRWCNTISNNYPHQCGPSEWRTLLFRHLKRKPKNRTSIALTSDWRAALRHANVIGKKCQRRKCLPLIQSLYPGFINSRAEIRSLVNVTSLHMVETSIKREVNSSVTNEQNVNLYVELNSLGNFQRWSFQILNQNDFFFIDADGNC